MNSKVSIIIPAYNAGKVLARCLDSMLEQTYPCKEIVVINDGSTDHTASICDDYASKYDCIKVIHKSNSGVSAARNTGLDAATGTYIAFVDSDDTADPEYLENLMAYSSYDFVTAGYHWQSPDFCWHSRVFPNDSITLDMLKQHPATFMGKYYFGSPWATLMKRELIEANHVRFNTQIHSGEDTLFIFEYLRNAVNIKILPQCGYRYFFYPTSLVHTRHQDYWKWKIEIESNIMDFFQPGSETELLSLLQRHFDVLRDLLRDYSKEMSARELSDLYKHPFFKDCIAYKKKKGKFEDRILIFSMEKSNYAFYTRAMQIIHLWRRIKNRIRRSFSGK